MMNWAYIAGFFDGEGTLSPMWCHVSICQNYLPVLEEIKSWLEIQCISSTIYFRRGKTNFGERKEKRLQLSGGLAVETFCRGILPFLRVKKVVVQDFLRYRKAYRPLTLAECGRLGNERLSAGARCRDNWRDPKTGQYARRRLT